MRTLAACLRGEIPRSPDWLDTIAQANEQLVTPYLHLSLTRRRGVTVPSDVGQYLQLVHDLNLDRNVRLKLQAVEAISALNAVGIQPTLLKGCVFLLTASLENLGARILSDLDMLLPAAELRTGAEALLGLGYRRADGHAGQHADGKFLRAKYPGAIDLHHRPPGPKSLYTFVQEDLGEPLALAGVGFVRVPSAVSRVTHLIAHDMFNDGGLATGRVHLRHFLDIAGWAQETPIDWARVRERFASPQLLMAFDAYILSLQRLMKFEISDIRHPCIAGRIQFGRQIFKTRSKGLRYVDDMLVRGVRRWRREQRRKVRREPSAT